GVVRADSGDDLRTPRGRGDDRAEDLRLLRVRRRRGLARRAGDDQHVVTEAHEVVDGRLDCRQVDLAGRGERGDHRRAHPAERIDRRAGRRVLYHGHTPILPAARPPEGPLCTCRPPTLSQPAGAPPPGLPGPPASWASIWPAVSPCSG